MRTSSNWWGGWDTEVSLQSMLRHVEDLTALEAGYRVFKVRTPEGEITQYVTSEFVPPEGENYVECDALETANAIKFNCNAYILQTIKNKCPKTNFPPPPNMKNA